MLDLDGIQGCHTDKVYLQPIKEITFLDKWSEIYDPSTMTEGNYILNHYYKFIIIMTFLKYISLVLFFI